MSFNNLADQSFRLTENYICNRVISLNFSEAKEILNAKGISLYREPERPKNLSRNDVIAYVDLLDVIYLLEFGPS